MTHPGKLKRTLLVITILVMALTMALAGTLHTNAAQIRGDMNEDGILNANDAIYMLRHCFMPSAYPIEQDGDLNGDNAVSSADAVYLLRHIFMPGSYPLHIVVRELEYTLSEDGTHYIVTGIGTHIDPELVIPDTYNDKPVTEIAADAFTDNTTLVSVIIGENIVKIGEYAFNNVENLTSITINNDNIQFADRIFVYNCNKLERIEFAGTTTYWEEQDLYLPENTKVIYGTKHTYTVIEQVDATCIESGYTVYHCECCDDMYTETIPSLGHSIMDGETILPTCTQAGSISGTCTVCGLEKEIPIEALGHQESEFIFTGEQCGENPVGHTECEFCGELVTEIGHRYETKVQAPTCTEDGYVAQSCTKCGKSDVIVTAAHGHDTGSTKIVRDATCTQEGIIHTLCKWCDTVLEEDIVPVTEHSLSSTIINNICIYECINCDYTQSVEIKDKYVYTLITGSGENLPPLYVEEGSIPVLPEPTWGEYTFEGWYYDIDFKNMYLDIPATGNLTLYAYWTSRQFTQSYESNTIINGNKDITFTVETDIKLTNENINEYIKADCGEKNVNLHIVSQEGNTYYVGGDFENSKIYNITVSEGITANGSDRILISVGEENEVNIQLKDGTKRLDIDAICGMYEQDGKYYFLYEKDRFDRGDICVVYEDTYDNIHFALEITAEGVFGKYYVYECISAQMNDTFEDFSIYLVNQEVDLSNVVFDEHLSENLVAQLMASPLYYEVTEASMRYASLKSQAGAQYQIRFKEITVPAPKFKVNNNKVTIDVRLVATFERYAIGSLKAKDAFYLTVRFDAEIGFAFTADVNKWDLLWGNMTVVLDTTINSGISFTFSTNVPEEKKEIKIFEDIILSVKKEGDAKKVESLLGECEKEISVCKPSVTFYGITLALDVKVVLSFGVTGEFTAGVDYATTKEVGIVMRGWELQDLDDDSATVHLYAYLSGVVKAGVALKLDASLSLLGFVGVGIDFSAGVVAEAGGMFIFSWNVGSQADWSLAGYFEIKLVFKSNVKAFAGSGKFKFEVKKEILNKSKSLLLIGDKELPFDFVIEGEDKDIDHDYNTSLEAKDIIDRQVRVQDLSDIKESIVIKDCEYYLISSSGQVSLEKDGTLTFKNINDESIDLVIKVVYKNLYKIVELTITNVHEHDYKQSVYTQGCLVDTVYRYTCSACHYHFDVTIMPAPGHTYGKWIGNPETSCLGDGYYTHKCIECGYTESKTEAALGHEFVDHFCIRCNQCDHADKIMNTDDRYLYKAVTCFSQAEYKYSCLYCGMEYEEYFKYGELLPHTYEDEFTCHDRACFYPGCTHVEVATTEHRYSDWIDEEISMCTGIPYKTRVCYDCGYTDIDAGDAAIAPHTYKYVEGLSPTCTEPGYTDYFECTECGQIDGKVTLSSTDHTFGKYVYNDDHHYKLCIHGCETTSDKQLHKYSDSCDPTCNTCGYKRKVAHEYSDTYMHDGEYHWKVCTKCHANGDMVAHTGGFTTCTLQPICNVCSHEYSEAAGHSFTATVITDKYLKQVANCTQAAVYYYSCETCGETSNKVFSYGDPLGHDKEEELSSNESGHWYACLRDGCNEKFERRSHKGGVATCVDKAVCDTCGVEYGELSKIHVPEYEATCEHAAKCSLCGKEYGNKLPHTGGSATCQEKAICDMCGEEYGQYAPHTGGEATCSQKAVCHVCGEEYGTLKEHEYTEIIISPETFVRDATCLLAARYYFSCKCSAVGTETFSYGQPLGHLWSDEYAHDASSHWMYCTRDNCSSKLKNEKHLGGMATCTESPICDICDTEYGKANGHSYTLQIVDDKYISEHATCTNKASYYYLCATCNNASDKDTYEVGESLGHLPGEEFYWNTTTHWHTCIRENCGIKLDVTDHNGGRTSCTEYAICVECNQHYGELKEHTGGNATCTKPAQCEACGNEYGNTIPHTGGHSTCLEKAKCDVCGQEYGALGQCVFTVQDPNDSNTLKTKPTCSTPGVYYYKCEVCGKTGNKTYTFGYVEHDYSSMNKEEKYLLSAATCENDAIYYYSCQYNCGNMSTDTFVVENSRLGHKLEMLHDDTKHWNSCSREGCDYVQDEEQHVEETPATCTRLALCSVCRVQYGQLKAHVYSEKNTDAKYCIEAPTCTQMGEYYYSCACGAVGEATFFVVANGHKIENASVYLHDDESHWQVCSSCGVEVGRGIHAGGVATCEQAGSCEVCSAEYINAIGHNFDTKYTIDTRTHYYKCLNEGCNSKQSEAKHYLDENNMEAKANCLHGNICAACEFEYTDKLETHKYSNYENDDAEHWRICKDCGKESRGSHRPIIKATCINRNLCEVCGQEYGELLDHVENTEKWLQVDDGENYYHYHSCQTSGCTQIFSQGDHTFGDWVIGIKPGCLTTGQYERACTVCGLKEYQEILPTGHSYYLEPEETDLENGYLSIAVYEKCHDCDYKSQYSDEALIHIHNKPVRVEGVKPTCTEDGLSTGLKCWYCDEMLYEQTVIPPMGHNFVDNICIRCMLGASEGLEFTLSDDGTHYIVSEGICSDNEIVIPSKHNGLPVWVIADNAFADYTNITSVSIPNGIRIIGENAFAGCMSLTKVYIPASVTSIGLGAFTWCTDLEEIMVHSDNKEYFSHENCLINTDEKVLILGCMNSVIPSDGSVETIGDSAFAGCESLETIIIPESVTMIDDWAFGYTGLMSVTIPEYVEVLGNGVFMGCWQLSDIEFAGQEKLTDIGDYAFADCEALVYDVFLPSNVTTIGTGVFSGCTSLEYTVWPKLVSKVSDNAFYNCSALTGVLLQDNITSIGDSAFAGCVSLTDITLCEKVENIGKSAFARCESLTTFSVPSLITVIKEGTFSHCTQLTNISLPAGLKEIEYVAFSYCSSLQMIYFQTTDPNAWVLVVKGDDWDKECGQYTVSILSTENPTYAVPRENVMYISYEEIQPGVVVDGVAKNKNTPTLYNTSEATFVGWIATKKQIACFSYVVDSSAFVDSYSSLIEDEAATSMAMSFGATYAARFNITVPVQSGTQFVELFVKFTDGSREYIWKSKVKVEGSAVDGVSEYKISTEAD